LINILVPYCKAYAYIKHIDTKTEHYHILLSLTNAREQSAFEKECRKTDNHCNVQVWNGNVKAYEYLTHKNDPDKEQYNESDIIQENMKNVFTETPPSELVIVKQLLENYNPRALLTNEYSYLIFKLRDIDYYIKRVKSYDMILEYTSIIVGLQNKMTRLLQDISEYDYSQDNNIRESWSRIVGFIRQTEKILQDFKPLN
jgi:hypothetical protein